MFFLIVSFVFCFLAPLLSWVFCCTSVLSLFSLDTTLHNFHGFVCCWWKSGAIGKCVKCLQNNTTQLQSSFGGEGEVIYFNGLLHSFQQLKVQAISTLFQFHCFVSFYKISHKIHSRLTINNTLWYSLTIKDY